MGEGKGALRKPRLSANPPRLIGKQAPALQLRLQIRIYRRHHQLFPGPGHGNVKHPQLLAHAFQLQLPLQYLLFQGGHLQAAVQIHVIRRHAQIRINEKAAVCVLFIEFFPHTGQNHNRKFQALALVDAHDAHSPVLAASQSRFPEICIYLF